METPVSIIQLKPVCHLNLPLITLKSTDNSVAEVRKARGYFSYGVRDTVKSLILEPSDLRPTAEIWHLNTKKN